RYRGESGTNGGMNYICGETGEPGAERVQTICLDDFCRERCIRHIDLLKIDVQGNEHCVLQGAEGLIKLARLGTVFMELNWADDAGGAATESIRLLADAGYRFASAAHCNNNWREAGNWLQGLSDIIARRYEGA